MPDEREHSQGAPFWAKTVDTTFLQVPLSRIVHTQPPGRTNCHHSYYHVVMVDNESQTDGAVLAAFSSAEEAESFVDFLLDTMENDRFGFYVEFCPTGSMRYISKEVWAVYCSGCGAFSATVDIDHLYVGFSRE